VRGVLCERCGNLPSHFKSLQQASGFITQFCSWDAEKNLNGDTCIG
jgi:hypothetical protein